MCDSQWEVVAHWKSLVMCVKILQIVSHHFTDVEMFVEKTKHLFIMFVSMFQSELGDLAKMCGSVSFTGDFKPWGSTL